MATLRETAIAVACRLNGITQEQFDALDRPTKDKQRYMAKCAYFGIVICGYTAEEFRIYAKTNFGIRVNDGLSHKIVAALKDFPKMFEAINEDFRAGYMMAKQHANAVALSVDSKRGNEHVIASRILELEPSLSLMPEFRAA